MKTTLLLLFVVCVGVSAQITITSGDMPSLGDTSWYSNANPDSLSDYQQTGANHTWDFTYLLPQSQMLLEYESASSINAAYGSFFSPGAYGSKVADSITLPGAASSMKFQEVYDFYSNTASVFKATGRAMKINGVATPFNYIDADEIYGFPLAFGNSTVTTFSYSINIPGLGIWNESGSRSNTVDGWGTVKTPYADYSCLRVKSEITGTDTLIIDLLPGIIPPMIYAYPLHKIEYKWVSNSGDMPVVFEVLGDIKSDAEVISIVRYTDIKRDDLDPSKMLGFKTDNHIPQVGDTVTLTDTTDVAFLYARNWVFSPSTVTYVGGTSQVSDVAQIVFQDTGKYSVTLKISSAQSGSFQKTVNDFYNVSISTGINNLSESISIYPNPAVDVLRIHSEINDVAISLTDMSGRVVFTQVLNNGDALIDVSNLKSGMYVAHIKSFDKVMYRKVQLLR